MRRVVRKAALLTRAGFRHHHGGHPLSVQGCHPYHLYTAMAGDDASGSGWCLVVGGTRSLYSLLPVLAAGRCCAGVYTVEVWYPAVPRSPRKRWAEASRLSTAAQVSSSILRPFVFQLASSTPPADGSGMVSPACSRRRRW